MESILKLNRQSLRRLAWLVVLVAVMASPVGLLWQQLTAIYAQPNRPLASNAPVSTRREDGVLFERAVAAGLLRLGKDRQIAIAPIDLPLRRYFALLYPALVVPTQGEFNWFDRVWDEQIRQLHRALYFSAAGRYVRQEIESFNANQQSTLRWQAVTHLLEVSHWQGVPLHLIDHKVPAVDGGAVESSHPLWRGAGSIQYQAGKLLWQGGSNNSSMTGLPPQSPLSASATLE